MIKKFLIFCFLFMGFTAYAGPIANVQYIHDYIQQKHNITIPINPATSGNAAANTKYMLCVVDIANRQLNNGVADVEYCNNVLATTVAIDTIAVTDAVDRLIKSMGKFNVFLTNVSGTFSFEIGASGDFSVDWGDGSTPQQIKKTDTNLVVFSHNYSTGNFQIKINGLAKKYSSISIPAIKFYNGANASKITRVSGDLGQLFPVLGTGARKTPVFVQTFQGTGLSGKIPADLFASISGAPVSGMFKQVFASCTGLTGSIPPGLFAGVSGAPASDMFQNTFYGCTGLTGEIPADLFASISGAPANNMFQGTFSSCKNLTGIIPGGLFGEISGAPANGMFQDTFKDCTGFTGIGSGLFDNINGPETNNMFISTFRGCTGLAGFSATSDGQFLYEKWPGSISSAMCYYGTTNLTDYGNIPTNWR